MYTFIAILIMIACVLLGLVVLVQNPKGGGLNSSMGGVSTQVFGAKNSTQLVEKVTWGLAIAIVVLSLGSAIFIDGNKAGAEGVGEQSETERILDEGRVETGTTVNINDIQAPEGLETETE